ncbi:MAG: branched-chain amino acid ABC transporter permease [Sphaerobacter sp.]|nr:branched-chain amino acid ABC transporter permease [Sphaerobacter sp.]
MDTTLLIQALVNGLLIGMVYALISVGLTLIFGLMEIVNFAHGEFLMLAMYAAFWGSVLLHLDPMVSLPLTVAGLGLLGLVTYRGIIAQILRAPMLAQIFATFGLGLFLRGLAQYLWSPNFRTVERPWLGQLSGGTVDLGGVFLGVPQIAAAVLAALAFAALSLFISRTRVGLALQAVAEDRATATLMGIDSNRMFALGWVIGGACVGLAGAVLACFYPITPTVGILFGLMSYIVVALGGFGSVPGALVAGLLVGLVQEASPIVFGVPTTYKYAVVFALYLVVVLIRPQGLFGRF